jgi:FSR family fosmidomycin resistance protein-like MFS transporter
VSLAGIDRRRIGVLALGHFSVDVSQGAVPALLPFMVIDRGYSFTQASALVLALLASSSVIQPVFGRLTDLRPLPWLLVAAVLIGGGGIAVTGWVSSYPATFAAVVIAGLGVAAYHPEGARYANYVSGSRRATGMSIYAVGGNAGIAAGPIIVTPLILIFGLHGTAALLILPLIVAAVVARQIPRLRAASPASAELGADAASGVDQWGAFSRLTVLIVLRSAVFYGMVTFVPLYFISELGSSEAGGNAALSVMLVCGAIGTLIGGRLADRFGRRIVLQVSMAVLTPLLAVFLLGGPVVATLAVALIGAASVGSFSTTLVMSQEYLPRHLGLASGVSLGFAIGIGGMGAAALGPLADASGIPAVIKLIAILPLPVLALALTLPHAEHPTAGATAAAPAGPDT